MSFEQHPKASPGREEMILDRVRSGCYDPITWSPITAEHKGRTAVFRVFSDALKMDGIRINVTAETEQRIADLLGCFLLTPKIADLIWLQRDVTLYPSPQPISSTTKAMFAHSQRIDAALEKLGNPTGLLCTVGKHWVLDNALLSHTGFAENYGWHFEGATYKGIKGEVAVSLAKDDSGRYLRVIQGCGWRHGKTHVDYSQTVVLVSSQCEVDGQPMALGDVLTSKDLSPLASHNGPLRLLRLPGTSEI